MPRKAMRDVVICLPGVTGGVPRKDGRDVWNISGSALSATALGSGAVEPLTGLATVIGD
jgi:hypothetical protein